MICNSNLVAIGKEKKRVQRTKPVTLASHSRSVEELKAALEAIRAEPLPGTPEEKEQYFMDNVAMGEGLCSRGKRLELFDSCYSLLTRFLRSCIRASSSPLVLSSTASLSFTRGAHHDISKDRP